MFAALVRAAWPVLWSLLGWVASNALGLLPMIAAGAVDSLDVTPLVDVLSTASPLVPTWALQTVMTEVVGLVSIEATLVVWRLGGWARGLLTG